MKYVLQCPRCKDILHWERKSESDGPGHCHCGAWAPWNVLKEEPHGCPICGKHHDSFFICEDDWDDFVARDWGDL
jgi:hypothetical protein